MADQNIDEILKKVSGACVCFIPFLVVLMVASIFVEVEFSQFEHSDPLVRLFGTPLATIVTLLLGVLACVFWFRFKPVSSQEIKVSALWGAAGSIFAGGVLLAIYFVNGPQLPTFIPPEESSGSGLVLGLTAGMFEEIVFRLMLLPFLLVVLSKRLAAVSTHIASILLIGLLFSLSHELAGDPFQLEYFITRFAVPGIVMSIAFLKLHPSAIVCGHSAAHIGIAVLFTSGY